MAQILGLPKLSPTMEEGVLVRWTKKEGDKVSPGDLIAEVETDKANMDFNVEDEGVLLKLLVKEGETVKLGAPVAIIGKAGEDVSALETQAKAGGAAKPEPKKAEAKPAAKAEAKPAAKPEPKAEAKPAAKVDAKADAKPEPKAEAKPASNGKLLASPLAKTLAIELGIDLRTVTGSGPGGRIIERDVKAAAEGGGVKAAPEAEAEAEAETTEAAPVEAKETAIAVRNPRQMVPDADGDYNDAPTSNMRKRIAQRLTEASRDIPQFYLMRTFDVAPLLGFRERLNTLLGDKGKVSVNDLIIKAVALALRRVPDCNASWEGDAIRHYHHVHIGVAVAIEDGLVTPVIRNADQKGIGSIAAEVRDLADRAKKRQLKGPEITGSTFTVSNLGMFSIERFTAILNPPEAGILAIGGTVDTPVVQNGQVVVGKRMTVTMTCDHRVIDGALGAKWLAAFVDLAEHPESLAL
ncbi:MAG TPA: pyruvate dehydrogenase complex dihydrolipoamide acetyltransferase [Kofleriaceae bacterium]